MTIHRMVAALALGLLVMGCGKKEITQPVTPDDKPSRESSTSDPASGDLAALQGTWVVDKVEFPEGLPPPPEDVIRAFEITVKGNLVTARARAKGIEEDTHGLIDLYPTRTPKEANLTLATPEGKPRPEKVWSTRRDDPNPYKEYPPPKFQAIYRFDGETLVIATPVFPDDPPRPKDFKPVPRKNPKSLQTKDAEIVVIYLKQKAAGPNDK